MTVRTRILLIFLVTLAGGFFALERWLSLELRPRYYQSFEEPLVDMANILAEIASQEFEDPSHDFDRLQAAFERVYRRRLNADIYGLNKDNVDIRVYITDRYGIVVFDSYKQAVGQDFSNWLDVNRTLQGKYGARSSPLAETPRAPHEREARSIAYIAAPIYRDSNLVGVLSVGKPKVNVSQFILTAREDLLWAVLGVAVLVVVTVTMLYLWVSRPLYQVADFAERIGRGETVAVPDLGRNEIGGVANAIAAMRRALDGKHYIERYTQTLAHELKSPLTSIKATAELLLEDMSDAQRQRFTANIQSENERALNLIQRLLELAAVENRQGYVEKKPVKLKDLFEEIADSLHATLLQKNVTLALADPITIGILGERFLIKQALFNVVENAVDFSPSGGQVKIAVDNDKDHCIITVRDQGPGIPEYARERIFERFYSLPRPNSNARGSGLGLSFVKEVLELHQGSVSLVSDDCGTVAVLTFPIAQAS
ncbi:MAG: two-component system sensor histidine kinase CreC [Gammaproteobacteria bacterium]